MGPRGSTEGEREAALATVRYVNQDPVFEALLQIIFYYTNWHFSRHSRMHVMNMENLTDILIIILILIIRSYLLCCEGAFK